MDGSASTSALVPRAPRQPEKVPSSLTNRKASPLKADVPLNTWPVTEPSPGMVTVSASLVVAWVTGLTLYTVDVPAPFEETQNGLVAERDRPQALTRPG